MNPTIRRMTAADIPRGMSLTEQNDWNTLPEDWERQLDLEPDGCFVAAYDGHVVGTACACIFGDVAWINLVLVGLVYRGRGIGTALMRAVLGWLDARGQPSIRLDATPLGRPLYENLGFTAEYELTRYEGVLPLMSPGDYSLSVTAAQASDLPALIEYDRSITGGRRDPLIRYLFERIPITVVRDQRQILGYAAYRPGFRARHIGPCLGPADACRRLLATLAQELRGELVFLDIPSGNAAANAWAIDCGLTPQRHLTRMVRGAPISENLDEYWCGFGPEKG